MYESRPHFHMLLPSWKFQRYEILFVKKSNMKYSKGPFIVNGSQICQDVNECDPLAPSHNCDVDVGICHNNDGGFTCSCPAGFNDLNGDGTVCEDWNECNNEGDGHNCGDNTSCVNKYGTFECQCMQGFENLSEQDGEMVCSDILEVTHFKSNLLKIICLK